MPGRQKSEPRRACRLLEQVSSLGNISQQSPGENEALYSRSLLCAGMNETLVCACACTQNRQGLPYFENLNVSADMYQGRYLCHRRICNRASLNSKPPKYIEHRV